MKKNIILISILFLFFNIFAEEYSMYKIAEYEQEKECQTTGMAYSRASRDKGSRRFLGAYATLQQDNATISHAASFRSKRHNAQATD